MTPESLSQEEINALLKGGVGGESEAALSVEDKRALSEFARIVGDGFSNAVGGMLGTEITVDLGEMAAVDADGAAGRLPRSVLVAAAEFTRGLSGRLSTLWSADDAAALTGALGNDNAPADAVAGVLDATMTAACQALGAALGQDVDLEPHAFSEMQTTDEAFAMALPSASDKFAMVAYTFHVRDLSGTFHQAVPMRVLKTLASVRPQSTPSAPARAAEPAPAQPQSRVKTVQFEELAPSAPVDTTNLALILDIGLNIRVELGHTSMKVRDILDLGPGAVVELDKLAGEPVELIVNDKLFAKGEVVVIDENFGVRITDILSIQERIESLK